MASYIIAGKADDPSFARAEYAAKQIEAACPNVMFHYEMKLPEHWKEFITTVFRRYDFDAYSEEFAGPLVWTHEGELIGSSAEFVQHVCVEKFGVESPPSVTDPMFKQIAIDNYKQVKLHLHREQHGLPFAEKCDVVHALGIAQVKNSSDRRCAVVSGAPLEVWVMPQLHDEYIQLHEMYGCGEPARIDKRLSIDVVGLEQSHLAVLHPCPLVQQQIVLLPRRHVITVGDEEGLLEVPPSNFRSGEEGELGRADFFAAVEVLTSIGGVVTWMGLRKGKEYRHPLDTHLQVFPFPIHHAGEDCPLRYPLELVIDRALKDGKNSLNIFKFRHILLGINPPASPDQSQRTNDLAKAAVHTYEKARGKPGSDDSLAVVFTITWMMLAWLEPPDVDTVLHEAWFVMPPPPPCALCGVVVCPLVLRTFPDTMGDTSKSSRPLVSSRAQDEGIPEGTVEFEAASREVNIATRILDMPLEIINIWASQA